MTTEVYRVTFRSPTKPMSHFFRFTIDPWDEPIGDPVDWTAALQAMAADLVRQGYTDVHVEKRLPPRWQRMTP